MKLPKCRVPTRPSIESIENRCFWSFKTGSWIQRSWLKCIQMSQDRVRNWLVWCYKQFAQLMTCRRCHGSCTPHLAISPLLAFLTNYHPKKPKGSVKRRIPKSTGQLNMYQLYSHIITIYHNILAQGFKISMYKSFCANLWETESWRVFASLVRTTRIVPSECEPAKTVPCTPGSLISLGDQQKRSFGSCSKSSKTSLGLWHGTDPTEHTE